jgi:hypothetical protein
MGSADNASGASFVTFSPGGPAGADRARPSCGAIVQACVESTNRCLEVATTGVRYVEVPAHVDGRNRPPGVGLEQAALDARVLARFHIRARPWLRTTMGIYATAASGDVALTHTTSAA